MALDIPEKYKTGEGDLNLAGFIQGKVGFTLTDLNVLTITTNRNANYEDAAKNVDERTRDLCWADALIIFVSIENTSIQDGGSSESRSIPYSRDEAERYAMYLYGKWGEDIISANEVTDKTDLW